jgi:predicted dehydrogenase
MRVAIIGAGLIGKKRAGAMVGCPDEISYVVDKDIKKAESFSDEYSGKPLTDWEYVVNDPTVDCVVVATTHNSLAEISAASLKAKKHVLCEKPLGISSEDVKKCVELARKAEVVYAAGFNHRFHPAISLAYRKFREKNIGELMYMKADYGIGGRPGYEKEWRMDSALSGGGELIDQGAHLIDLCYWFAGRPASDIQARLINSFWETKVEDNVFLILGWKKYSALIHASWTEWKNRFSFEVYGKQGYLKIYGLGGSYGKETLIFGKRIPGQAPIEEIWNFETNDISWRDQWINFRNSILGRERIIASGEEGYSVLKTINQVYNTYRIN